MAIAYEGKHPDVDVKYTMIPMTNGEYQTKLKAALGTADVARRHRPGSRLRQAVC